MCQVLDASRIIDGIHLPSPVAPDAGRTGDASGMERRGVGGVMERRGVGGMVGGLGLERGVGGVGGMVEGLGLERATGLDEGFLKGRLGRTRLGENERYMATADKILCKVRRVY